MELNYIYVIPPIWQISDRSIVDFIDDEYRQDKITIIGLKPGEVTVSFDNVRRKIKVIDEPQ